MAGGNLSPRQKMINMMYLVLTALLALNVSAEILDAFNSLRESLRASAESFREKNTDTQKGIVDKVNEEMKSGNKKNEIVIKMADDLDKKTSETLNYIEGLVKKLEEYAEKDPETGELKMAKETEKNYRFWMIGESGGDETGNGGRGTGEAMKLRETLNGYVKWANEFPTKYFPNDKKRDFKDIAIDPKDDKAVPASNESKEKPWEYFTFHGKPAVADLAMLEKFKLDVQEIQSELLNYLKEKLGAVTFKIDSLIAVDAPVSRVVAAGMKFETKLFVAMSSKDVKPQFSGAGVSPDPGGQTATMTFTAPGGFAAKQTEKKATYTASIKVPKADGSFANLTVNGEYTIRKPEVVITSASVQNLYRNCGNIINVDVPALGEFYNPAFTASEAEIIKSQSDKRIITIVPRGSTCTLGVSSNTNGQNIKIDDVKYKVIAPPKPSIVLKVNGQDYNGATPINKKSTATVIIKPDGDFLNALPKDARYAISKVDLLSQRSLGAPETVGSFSGSGKDATKGVAVEMGSKLNNDPPGTKIYFKIDKVYRINFQNKQVEEKFGDRDLYIGAVIK